MKDDPIATATDIVQGAVGKDGRARLDSHYLLGDRQEVIITHGGDEYRLRQTRQGKLILTK